MTALEIANHVATAIGQQDPTAYTQSSGRVLAAAIGSFDADAKTQFVEHLRELETRGTVSIAAPSFLANGISKENVNHLTEDEVRKYLVVKAAHKVWIDKTRMVGWRLADYPDTALQTLFDRQYMFNGAQFRNRAPIDYDPSVSFAFARSAIRATREATILALLESVRGFRHVRIGEDERVTSLEYALQEKVSREGCHSMASMIADLALSLNIPAYRHFNTQGQNWFAIGHASIVFPNIGFVPHGDSVYCYTGVKTRNLVIPWQYFLDKIVKHEQSKDTNPEAYPLHYKQNAETVCAAERLDLGIVP